VKKERYKDCEIIEGLRQGNDDVLNFLYKNYYGAVRSLVLNSYGTEDQARDIFQEVIIVIYNKLQDSNFKITSSFFTFFYAVIKNTWLDFRKMKKINPLGGALDYNDEIGFDSEEVELLATRALRSNLFYTYLKQMKESCQKILSLTMEDYSSEEIAATLDLKSGSYVRKRKSDCLKVLIEKIRKDRVFKELL
jgi:RNA polymerase sigma factor (sigma-70 family)